MIIYGHIYHYLPIYATDIQAYFHHFPSLHRFILLSLCQWSTRTHQKWAERRCIVQENMNQEVTTGNSPANGHDSHGKGWKRPYRVSLGNVFFPKFPAPAGFPHETIPFSEGQRPRWDCLCQRGNWFWSGPNPEAKQREKQLWAARIESLLNITEHELVGGLQPMI